MEQNAAQEQVIQATDGQLLVIACPGSGKTTTLLRRINAIREQGRGNVLMVTFTAAAASEMRERYAAQYRETQGVTFSTIHALCFAILKKFAGYTNDSLLKPSEAWTYFFSKIQKEEINDKAEFISALMTDISAMKNNRIPETEYDMGCCRDRQLFLKLYYGYEAFKEGCRKIDFDDMLLAAYETMQGDCLKWLQDQYQYIQVDEYQDTNYIQRDIIYRLAGPDGNLAVVGDDDQSIYAFRGARPAVMMGFQKDYPKCRVIRMGVNYRSCPEIIETAGNLIRYNKERFQKDFVASRQEKGAVKSYVTRTRPAQNILVVQQVKDLLAKGEKDIAVLYRTNQQAEAFAYSFLREEIPFVSMDPLKSRYEHWMYTDIRAYYRLALGIGTVYDFSTAANHPQRWIHPSLLREQCERKEMLKKLKRLPLDDWKLKKMEKHVNEFFLAVDLFRMKKPADALDYLYTAGGYQKYIDTYAEYRNEDPDELKAIWAQYKKDLLHAENDWKKWEQYIRGYNEALKNAKDRKDGVVLATMHKSKGLEWKHVLIPDCIDGIVPYKRAETPQELEEERRLFYVAVTRARNDLSLFSYKSSGKKTVKPSPYLAEMLNLGN